MLWWLICCAMRNILDDLRQLGWGRYLLWWGYSIRVMVMLGHHILYILQFFRLSLKVGIMFNVSILDNKKWKIIVGKALAKISASWNLVLICIGVMTPFRAFSLTKWKSNSICLVLSWKIGFLVRWRAAWLWQSRRAGWGWSILKSFSRYINHMISQLVWAKAQYSASTDERETVACFFDFQLTKEFPLNIQNPITDLLVSRQVAQSKSLKALRCKRDWLEKKMPCPMEPFRYFRILWAAYRWVCAGLSVNWLRIFTVYVIYGLVIDRQISRPINLL